MNTNTDANEQWHKGAPTNQIREAPMMNHEDEDELSMCSVSEDEGLFVCSVVWTKKTNLRRDFV